MINDHFGEFPPLTPPKGGKNGKFQDFSNFLNSGAQTVNICHFFYLLILSQNNMSKKFQNKIGRFRWRKKVSGLFSHEKFGFFNIFIHCSSYGGQNQSKYFFLASYQLSPGVENKNSTKKYFRGGQKIQKFTFFIKNEHFEICKLCNGLQYPSKPVQIFFLTFVSTVLRCRR